MSGGTTHQFRHLMAHFSDKAAQLYGTSHMLWAQVECLQETPIMLEKYSANLPLTSASMSETWV